MLALDAGGDAGRFYHALDELAVPWTTVPAGRDFNPRLAANAVLAVRGARADLLHTHLVHADVYGALAATLTRTPLVSSRHNDDRYLLGPFRYVDRLFARRARRLIAISDAVRRFLEGAGHNPRKLVTVRYGLDEVPDQPSELTPAQAGIPEGVPLALAIGRLTRQKDHATLLRAFANTRIAVPQARLAVLGIGPLERETRALAEELRLTDSVLFPGRLEISDWLARADLFVHTSRWEGFGIVILEAMLAGLPVVATSVSAVPEIVVEGETGLLSAPGDSGALGRHMTTLLQDAEARRVLGRAGEARARSEFSVARMTDETLHVYEQALA
jgi:glycosyltransferase involved in cell wall biosynthesis